MVGFKVGQKVVYPNHGIGTIEQIEQKQIGATLLPFYTLRLAANNSVVLVPVSNASEVGLRAPISSGECDMLFKALGDDFSSPANDWKDRFKEFSDKMRTGDIFEVAEVLKHLTYLSNLKPLSFREQRMLERARYLVVASPSATSIRASTRHSLVPTANMTDVQSAPAPPERQSDTEKHCHLARALATDDTDK
jgi:CarD family transcriptional regulator